VPITLNIEWHRLQEASVNSQEHPFIHPVTLQLTVIYYYLKSASKPTPLSFNAESTGISVCFHGICVAEGAH
jgi:hypothetical protein